ncbi:MAG: DUF1836 domain-containing protein [Clostridia bacterium]|nr:DUF1836 domain-containing protein [Clostridia bacterium]
MNNSELLNIVNDALNESELKSSEIPNIDLYVDQIINLIGEKLKEGSERYSERQLTKTMINNYSKDGLITPVKGKKYNKEQILQMLTVYTLKGTLSIGEIKRLLQGAYSSDGFDGEALQHLYDNYLDIKDVNREHAVMALEGIVERNGFDVENDVDYISTVCALVAFSAQLRNIAQAMIDARFPEPEEPEEDEKDVEKAERKEEKRVEKAERKEEKRVEKAERKEDKENEKAEKKQKKEDKKAKEE